VVQGKVGSRVSFYRVRVSGQGRCAHGDSKRMRQMRFIGLVQSVVVGVRRIDGVDEHAWAVAEAAVGSVSASGMARASR
jgi:hypothetical protein